MSAGGAAAELEVPAAASGWEAWRVREVGGLGRIYGGLSGKVKADFGAGRARYVPFTMVLEHAVLRANGLPRVRVGAGERQNEVRAGDLLFNGSSEVPDELALSACVASVPDRTYLNSFCFGYRLNSEGDADPRFLAYWFRGPGGRRLLYALAQGAIRYNLSKARFKDLRLALPSLAEQRAIAAALASADETIAALERLIAKKRGIKRGTMQQLLTGRTRLGGFDRKWRSARIGDFAACAAGGTPNTSVPRYWGGEIRWMSSGELHLRRVHDVQGRITPAGLAESSAQAFPPGTVLIGLAGQGKTRGTVAIAEVPLTTNQSIAGILPGEQHWPEFVYYNLDRRYAELRGMSTGDGGRGGLNLAIIRAIPIEMPPLEEQRTIAAILADMDAEIEAIEGRLAKTRGIKRGMMQELLTGRTRLTAEAVAT